MLFNKMVILSLAGIGGAVGLWWWLKKGEAEDEEVEEKKEMVSENEEEDEVDEFLKQELEKLKKKILNQKKFVMFPKRKLFVIDEEYEM